MSKKNFISEAALKDKPQNKYHLIIKDGAVSTDKLADSAVKTEKIADENVTTEKIKDRAVTNDKVADKTLTADKFSEELNHDTIEAIKELQETKFDKENVVQELGDSEEKVVSQAALPFRYIQSEEFIFAQVDAEDHLLFGIQLDGTPVFGKKSSVEEGLQSQVTLLAERVATIIGDEDTTNVIDSMNELKQFFANIENTQKLTDILLKLDTVYNNLNTTMDKVEKTVIKDEEGNVLQTPFKVIDSPEFLHVVVDAEDHFLFGIQQDGSVEWAKGIPAPIREKLNEIVNQTATDKADLSTKIDELNASMQIALDTKVDKEEGKSLIDDEVKNCFELIENDEWLTAMVDAENHLLFGIRRDTGKPYFPLNDMYHVEQNEEFFALWLDEEDHILMGIRRDGEIVGEIHAVNALKQTIAEIQSNIDTLQSDVTSATDKINTVEKKVSTIDASLQELLNVFSIQDNEEYLEVKCDSQNHIIEGIDAEGEKFINLPLKINNGINFNSRTIKEESIEDYKELTLDSKNHILRCVDKDGNVHENRHTIFRSVEFNENNGSKISASVSIPRTMNLPKYGYTNIKEETFYLTANDNYTDKDGIMAMLVNADTQENAQKGLTPYKYYVKNTLAYNDGVYSIQSSSVALDFYVPSDVKEVDGSTYVTSSLTKGDDGSYTVNENSIKVTKIVDVPNVQAWKVSKSVKHWCVVDIDFGSFLKGTYNVLVSFQGSSTLYNREKNFRYAFVKNDYKTKQKLKIGELLNVDKFNLKSYYSDDTKLKEPIIFRLYLQTKENRSYNEQYPWNSSTLIQSGATGIIKNFPVCTSVGGKFYGIQFFGYKKDKANYMLSGDEDGMIISGGVGCNWKTFDWSTWEDEMNDEPTESNRIAVQKFYEFINGSDFTKENAPKHMNINDWIDYFIFIQVFRMRDNDIHNLILYSGKDKQVFSPFLYDLDLSFSVYSYNLEVNETNTVWIRLKELYWEEICDRYIELRNSVLNLSNFNYIVSDLQSNIDYSDFENGLQKWGIRDSKNTTGFLLSTFESLLNTFDNYFKK